MITTKPFSPNYLKKLSRAKKDDKAANQLVNKMNLALIGAKKSGINLVIIRKDYIREIDNTRMIRLTDDIGIPSIAFNQEAKDFEEVIRLFQKIWKEKLVEEKRNDDSIKYTFIIA